MALGLPSSGTAQGLTVYGRVVQIADRDSLGLVGAWVVLHRITGDSGAAIDSVRTDSRGRYQIRIAGADSGAAYVTSVSHLGVTYFSLPIEQLRGPGVTIAPLLVYDTSSFAPPIELVQRHIIVRRFEPRQGRRVLDILVLANRGAVTRIAPDTSRPVWQGALPRGAAALEVAESGVSEGAIYLRGDSVAVAAPVPPGERQIFLSYVLPGDRLELSLDQPVARLNVLAEDTAARLISGPLEPAGIAELELARFARFTGNALEPGTSVVLELDSAPFSPASWWWLIVVAAGIVLAAVLLRLNRAVPSAASLEVQLKAIEQVLAEPPAGLSAAELAAYRKRRAQLQERLKRIAGQSP